MAMLAGAGLAEVNGYRAYIIDTAGHIVRRVDLFCPDDDAATKEAQELVDGHDVELWQLDRRIAEFKHEE